MKIDELFNTWLEFDDFSVITIERNVTAVVIFASMDYSHWSGKYFFGFQLYGKQSGEWRSLRWNDELDDEVGVCSDHEFDEDELDRLREDFRITLKSLYERIGPHITISKKETETEILELKAAIEDKTKKMEQLDNLLNDANCCKGIDTSNEEIDKFLEKLMERI